MKHLDEYRDGALARQWAALVAGCVTKPWTLMEVCGGQTHSIVRFGIEELLPKQIRLVHGPGCPVCVTPVELIDAALEIASRPEVIFGSFGDMLRVPGTRSDLFEVKAAGGDVRVLYSPLDALRLAEQNPGREVVFFAVGFETTAPAYAMAVYEARRRGIRNFSLIMSQVLVPPALRSLLESPGNQVNGFLAAGHVCTVTGYREYEPIAQKYRVPIVVTGFEPVDILQGIYHCVRQLEAGTFEVLNQYSRSVRAEGNPRARELMAEVFETGARRWRGLGEIPASGLCLRNEYAEFDAERRFPRASHPSSDEPNECQAGLVLTGKLAPPDCPAFGTRCTPERPLGALMVSSEGACAAYYRYRGRPE